MAELRRVAPLRVVLTFDPEVHNAMWLMDYIPEIGSLESALTPTIPVVVDGIDGHAVIVLPVPHDCRDGMTVAHWRRPEAYLDPDVRAGGSALRQVAPAALDRDIGGLGEDLQTGRWRERYGHLMDLAELDCGLRLVIGGEARNSPRPA